MTQKYNIKTQRENRKKKGGEKSDGRTNERWVTDREGGMDGGEAKWR